MITPADLDAIHDFPASQAAVQRAVGAAMRSRSTLLSFAARYTSWNGFFGSGVASLSGKIGRNRSIFLDPDEPILALSDRSVLVGSYFFDAARDEFDDSSTPHRDSHRCLAQAFIAGLIRSLGKADVPELNAVLADPSWLPPLQRKVAQGYGSGSPDTADFIFRAMGYHLASEVLADQEFSLIDQAMRRSDPELVEHLEASTYRIAGQDHSCYHWLSIHSGHGGGVEDAHFRWAIQGVDRAFAYTQSQHRERLREQTLQGFLDFAKDHASFFAQVGR